MDIGLSLSIRVFIFGLDDDEIIKNSRWNVTSIGWWWPRQLEWIHSSVASRHNQRLVGVVSCCLMAHHHVHVYSLSSVSHLLLPKKKTGDINNWQNDKSNKIHFQCFSKKPQQYKRFWIEFHTSCVSLGSLKIKSPKQILQLIMMKCTHQKRK